MITPICRAYFVYIFQRNISLKVNFVSHPIYEYLCSTFSLSPHVCKTGHNYVDWIIDTLSTAHTKQTERHKNSDHIQSPKWFFKRYIYEQYDISFIFLKGLEYYLFIGARIIICMHIFVFTHTHAHMQVYFEGFDLAALRCSLCVILLRSSLRAMPWWTCDNFPVSPPLIFIDRVLITWGRKILDRFHVRWHQTNALPTKTVHKKSKYGSYRLYDYMTSLESSIRYIILFSLQTHSPCFLPGWIPPVHWSSPSVRQVLCLHMVQPAGTWNIWPDKY